MTLLKREASVCDVIDLDSTQTKAREYFQYANSVIRGHESHFKTRQNGNLKKSSNTLMVIQYRNCGVGVQYASCGATPT